MGIDVSHYNGEIDWTQVVTEHGFAFCKASQGISEIDPMFATNWAGMKAAGVLRGAYHYFLCEDDPTQQAQHFCNAVKAQGWEDTDLPPVLDLEDRPGLAAIGTEAMIANVHTWFGVVKQELGRQPILYCDVSFYTENGLEAAFMPYVYLWIARYGASDPGVSNFTFWQYSDNGSCPGIAGEGTVDLDSYDGAGIEGLKALIAASKIT